MNKPELLCPAGDLERLQMALHFGADAVYLAGAQFGMRAGAENFTPDGIRAAVQLAHVQGAAVHVTCNTLPRDDEMAQLPAYLELLDDAGVDAIIAADLGVITLAKRYAPHVALHVSTQFGVVNSAAAAALYDLGAQRVVLARELTLRQVADIRAAIDREGITGPSGKSVRIEMFCHGALCMAVSGKCWLSLHTRGKSANRGECLQSCRRDYIAVDRERGTEIALDNGYFMSPKDLKTIGFLDLMVKAGVTVFKIEGRARGPEYVRTAVECYGEALDAILEGRWSEEVSKSWDERLSTVFNRGFWDGWYQGATMLERTDRYGSRATKKKLYCGKCTGYYAKAGVGRFTVHGETIRPGDELLVCGPTTGAVFVRPEGLRVDDAEAAEAVKGDDVTFRVPEKIRENDRLYVMRETVEDELA